MREINYEDYFWQSGLIRLRGVQENDWESHYINRFDTPARLLLNYEVELPPTLKEAHQANDAFADFDLSQGRIMFTIETLEGDNVGGINLNSIDERNGTFSIGMQNDGLERGKGYGTSAIRILMKYAFLERRLNKYYGSILAGNTASASVLKKLGCKEEGVRRQMVYSNGIYHDEILYGLTKEEFMSIPENLDC